MRYLVKGKEIRSENAAKTAGEAAKPVMEWISSNSDVDATVDFGCGKLRYAQYLVKKSKRLCLVDSKIQLFRQQKILGEHGTIANYVEENWPNTTVMTFEQFEESADTHDLCFCANVLSAIPNTKIRSRVLNSIRRSINVDGKALFITQYRNSYFKEVSRSPNATPHLDGWLLKSLRGYSYYGIIDRSKLIALVERHGFKASNSWVKEGSAYVEAILTA